MLSAVIPTGVATRLCQGNILNNRSP